MKNDASSVLFRRLSYFLSPQLDIYEKLRPYAEEMWVLEIGFGTGIGVLQYASKATQVDAVEIDPAAVRFARRCFPIDNINWIEGDVTDAPWLGEKHEYDLVVMIEVLEHILRFGDACKQIKKVLRPKGQALITVPNSRRHRKKQEILNVEDWEPEEFKEDLMEFFTEVELLNTALGPLDDLYGRETPIIAACS